MMQVREFQKVRTLLFDGESALRSPAVQKEILNKLKIKNSRGTLLEKKYGRKSHWRNQTAN
jgi:hypothetical protein